MVNLRTPIYNYVDDIDSGLMEFLLDDESIKTVQIRNINVTENYLIPDNLDYGLYELKEVYCGNQKYILIPATAMINITKLCLFYNYFFK